jgi:hypothetical protein
MFDNLLAQLPTTPPRPPRTLPGLRISSVVPRSALLLPIVFVAFFALVPLSVMRSDPAMRLALGPTQNSQGRIVSAVETPACRGSTARRVIYSFSPEQGREYRGSATMCEGAIYYSVKEGDPVEVQYLSSDPAVNVLRGNSNNAPPVAIFFLMPLFVLALLSSMFVPQIRELLRARRLYKGGRLAEGTVVFVKTRVSSFRPGWPGSSASEVFVEFRSPTGDRREAVAWCANEWLVNQLAPGAIVHIAYSDDDPAKVALLEAFLR